MHIGRQRSNPRVENKFTGTGEIWTIDVCTVHMTAKKQPMSTMHHVYFPRS